MLGAGNYGILGFLVKLDEKGTVTTRSYDEVFVFLRICLCRLQSFIIDHVILDSLTPEQYICPY